MNHFNNIKTKIIKFSLIFLGILSILSVFYITFMRIRPPKEIPWPLTEYRFYFLIFLIIFYCYTILALYHNKVSSKKIVTLISVLCLPFRVFDTFIKHNKFCFPFYYKWLIYITENKDINHIKFLYYKIYMIPRVILLIIFLIDVYYFNYILMFYYFLGLGILPLSYNYYIYSLEFAKEKSLLRLELTYDNIRMLEKGNFTLKDTDHFQQEYPLSTHHVNAIYHDTDVSIREYFQLQNDNKTVIDYSYYGMPLPNENYYNNYKKTHNKTTSNITEKDFEKMEELFTNLEPIILNLYAFTEMHKKMQTNSATKKIILFIIILYFISWSYILKVSFYTLYDFSFTVNFLTFITPYAALPDPFSNVIFPGPEELVFVYDATIIQILIRIILGY